MLSRVLQVELSLLVPELGVGDGVEVPVAEACEDLPGVVAGGEDVGVGSALLPGDVVTPPDQLSSQTPHPVGPGRADGQALVH